MYLRCTDCIYKVLIVLYVYTYCLNSGTCYTSGILRKSEYFGNSDLIYSLINICNQKLLIKKNTLQNIYIVKASLKIFYVVLISVITVSTCINLHSSLKRNLL